MSLKENSPRFNSLTSEEYWDLRRVLDKRVKNRFSMGLSPEGQKAMEMAKADTEAELLRTRERKVLINNKYTHVNGQEVRQPKKTAEDSGKATTFCEVFERKSSARMRGDITDGSTSTDVSSERRRALDGGNLGNAMETVEIVTFDQGPHDSEAEERAIEETAQLNSVEKCLVWMEVNALEGTSREDEKQSKR